VRGYFKKRGYEDSAELGAYKIEKLPAGASSKQFTIRQSNSSTSSDSAKLKNRKVSTPVENFWPGTSSDLPWS
jgi:hypothetical protein